MDSAARPIASWVSHYTARRERLPWLSPVQGRSVPLSRHPRWSHPASRASLRLAWMFHFPSFWTSYDDLAGVQSSTLHVRNRKSDRKPPQHACKQLSKHFRHFLQSKGVSIQFAARQEAFGQSSTALPLGYVPLCLPAERAVIMEESWDQFDALASRSSGMAILKMLVSNCRQGKTPAYCT